MLRILNRQNPLPPLYCTEFSVQKIPTRHTVILFPPLIILNIPWISYIIKFIILIFFINYIYMILRVKSSEVRRKLACRRILTLRPAKNMSKQPFSKENGRITNVLRVLCASGTCLAPTEAERRCGSTQCRAIRYQRVKKLLTPTSFIYRRTKCSSQKDYIYEVTAAAASPLQQGTSISLSPLSASP